MSKAKKPKSKVMRKRIRQGNAKTQKTKKRKKITLASRKTFRASAVPIKAKKSVKSRKVLVKQVNAKTQKTRKRKIVLASRDKFSASAVSEFSAESLFKAKIKVIGIGGGGGSIVSEIGRSLEKATFVIADTDIRALKKKSGIKYFWFGEELTHGLGTGVNVDLAKRAAESATDKLSGIFKDQDIIIFVASLGGGLGSGATQVFADVARQFGGITLGIFTLPFKFEGKNKQRIAQNALKNLRQSLNVSLVIPNEKIFKVIDSSTPITNAFSTVNKSLIGCLESLIDLIYNPGVINIDFADLRTILKGKGNSAFLNTVEESGKNRIEKICEKIFVNPLLQNNGFKAEKILFDIAGSEDLSMFDVEKISSHIANLNPKAKIIFGISKNSKLKNKVKTTILMTGGQAEENVIIDKIDKKEPVAEVVKKEVAVVPAPQKLSAPKIKKAKPEKTAKKPEKPEKKENGQVPVNFLPVPENSVVLASAIEQKDAVIDHEAIELNKKTIRRSGLEIKKAEEMEEKKKIAQEKEWEIPAFLRKVKFKS